MLRKLTCRFIVKQLLHKENPSVFKNYIDTTTIFKRPNSSKFDLFASKSGRKIYHNEQASKKIGAFGIFMLGVPLTTFALGTWQIQRLRWKLDLIESLKQRSSGEPIELPNNLEELEDKEYHPVKVKGRFLYDKEFIVGPKSLIIDGAAASSQSKIFAQKVGTGYYIVTPFQLEDRDMTILVNRGWVPPHMRHPLTRQSSEIHGTVEIIGLVRSSEKPPPFMNLEHKPTDREWLYRDIKAMAGTIGAAPVYLDMVTKFNSKDPPISGQTHINIRNEHLSYVLVWYTLTAFTAGMWYTKFVKKLPIL